MAGTTDARVLHLASATTSVLLDARGPGLPGVVHWGGPLTGSDQELAELCDAVQPAVPNSALDSRVSPSLLGENASGHPGRPSLRGHREDGRAWSPLFEAWEVTTPAAGSAVVQAVDDHAKLSLTSELHLDGNGMLRVRSELRNDASTPYTLDELTVALPVPGGATELLDLSGRWCLERQPQRHSLPFGTWLRESRRGRTGHDAPLAHVAGRPGFGFRTGEVWALHVGWSGNHLGYVERLADGTVRLGGGELLLPGEVVLDPGATYTTPWVYAAYSPAGLDGVSAVFHRWLRSRDRHPRRPRPVVLNTWEAVYFDHDLDRLRGLADVAARTGIERFVLDDGWFRHRRDDTAGLGDWYVDEGVWPHGLEPLVSHVTGLGMEFGLWVEPEMVNPDSDLARAHPDWVMQAPGRTPPEWRHQQVLDIAHPDAFEYVLGRLDALLIELDIGFLKWDHNRDLVDAGHAGRAGVHEQTLATYRLLDELRVRHPSVEIESCASGGARVDLGILERTDRVWASDSNDALDRSVISLWTGLLLPPELIGTHVGPPRAHTTGRTHDLSFRAAVATFGHAGVEWDIASASKEELDRLAQWTAFVKEHRQLLHTGDVVRCDHPDPTVSLHGVVSADRSEALFAFVALRSSPTTLPVPAQLAGLSDDRSYQVRAVHPAGEPLTVQREPPTWTTRDTVLPGSALMRVGLPMPVLAPENALLLHLRAR